MTEPPVNLQPLLIVVAFFVFIWFAWGRQVKNSHRRLIFGWTLSAVAILALLGGYRVLSNRQHQNFKTLKSLEGAQPLDVDKNWHVVHFLLTGSAWGGGKPLSNVVRGGHEIGPNFGYGSARYLTPKEVREVADALVSIRKDDLRFKFKPEDLTKADLYTWHEGEGQEGIDGYLDVYERIRAYFLDAAEKGNGMLLFIL